MKIINKKEANIFLFWFLPPCGRPSVDYVPLGDAHQRRGERHGRLWFAVPVSYIFYVPETHIMYFIRRCWFLKCCEEIHYVPIGDGDLYPVDDGWEEVLGRDVYIMSQYFSPNAKYWTALSGNRTRAPPDRMWTLYHWAMESIHNMSVLVSCARDNLRGQKCLGPLKMSLEMAHKVIVPQKKKLCPAVS